MKRISLQMIDEFSKESEIDNISNSFDIMSEIISNSLQEISNKHLSLLPMDKMSFRPINSCGNGTMTTISDLDFLVLCESAQLELNSQTLVLSKWKLWFSRIILAWKNRKKKKPKKKSKKRLQAEYAKKIDEQINKPYEVYRFKYDLFNEVAKRMPSTSIIYNENSKIHLVCNKDLGINCNIFVGIKSGDLTKIWSKADNSFREVNTVALNELFEQKLASAGSHALKIGRVFNNLYYIINKVEPPLFFTELSVLALNDVLFKTEKSITSSFLMIVNYLKNTGYENILPYESFKDCFPNKEYFMAKKYEVIETYKNITKMFQE